MACRVRVIAAACARPTIVAVSSELAMMEKCALASIVTFLVICMLAGVCAFYFQ